MNEKGIVVIFFFGLLVYPFAYSFQPKSIIIDPEFASSDEELPYNSDEESHHSSDDDALMEWDEEYVYDPLFFLPFLKNISAEMQGNEFLLNGALNAQEVIYSYGKVLLPAHWQKYLMDEKYENKHKFNMLTLVFVYLCQLENDDKKVWAEMVDRLIDHMTNPTEEQIAAVGNIVNAAHWEQVDTEMGKKPVLDKPDSLRSQLWDWLISDSSTHSTDEDLLDSGFFE